jgi:hypothetical protein
VADDGQLYLLPRYDEPMRLPPRRSTSTATVIAARCARLACEQILP